MTWSPGAKTIVDQSAVADGIPTWIAEDIALMESGGNANAVGDKGTSFGLFQLHWGGQGTGYTAKQLKDPKLNAQIGLKNISPAVHAGQAKGLTGWSLLDYSATNSGHPGYAGPGHYASYESKLKGVYNSHGGVNSDPKTGTTTSGTIKGILPLVLLGIVGYALLS